MNFFELIKLHLKLGLLIVFLIPSLAWILAITSTPIYESKAKLLVESKELEKSNFNLFNNSNSPVQTQIEIIKSGTILDKVIREFNLRYRSGPKKGQYLDESYINRNFSASCSKNIDIVELRYKDPTPKKARNILQAIIDTYIEKNIELKASDTASAIRFLKKERNKAERDALDSSKRLREFEQRSKIISIEANQELLKSSYKLKDLKLETQAEHAKAKQIAEQLSIQLMSNIDKLILYNSLNNDYFIEQSKKDLFDKQIALIKIQSKHSDGNPEAEELKEQIKGNQKLLSNRIKELIGEEIKPETIDLFNNPLKDSLTKSFIEAKSNELAIQEKLFVIDNAIDSLQKRIDKLPSEKYIYTQLLRQNEIGQKRLGEIELKLIESRMKEVIDSHITNIRLIDPPSLETTPQSPNFAIVLSLSFIVGLLLAGVTIYLVEYFDDVIKTPDTLPKDIDFPLLGQLPETQFDSLPTAYKSPESVYSGNIHSIKTNLSFLSLSGNKKLLLVTSPMAEEGKSTVAVNLAITYAQNDKRVLLIDADVRNPSLHKYLSMKKDVNGISTILINETDFYDVVHKGVLGIVGFDYLPAGNIPPNPLQLLESERMKELLETARHIYDLVIIDTPPIGLFTDALLLAQYSDVVTLVARSNATTRKELTASIALLKKANSKSIGIILNGTTDNYHETYTYGKHNHPDKEIENYEKSAA